MNILTDLTLEKSAALALQKNLSKRNVSKNMSIIMTALVTTLKRQKSNQRNFLFKIRMLPPDFHVLLVLRHVIFTLFLILQIQNHSVHCHLDSNINTLRYDGEVNIGKMDFYKMFFLVHTANQNECGTLSH